MNIRAVDVVPYLRKLVQGSTMLILSSAAVVAQGMRLLHAPDLVIGWAPLGSLLGLALVVGAFLRAIAGVIRMVRRPEALALPVAVYVIGGTLLMYLVLNTMALFAVQQFSQGG